jgi:polyisoprenoid-binding protein YceI
MSVAILRQAVLPLVAAVGIATAGPRPFEIDRSHSEINFIAESPFLDAHGFFDTFTVAVSYDPDTVQNSSVQITIDPRSVNTRNARRDNHLKTCDFFCADSFPQITFQSTKVTRVGPDRLSIDGNFTMRGVTRALTVPARMVFSEGGRARFNGAFDLNRRDFGVNGQGGGGIIKDTVHVAFNFTLRDPAMRRGGPGAPGQGAPAIPPAPPRGQ